MKKQSFSSSTCNSKCFKCQKKDWKKISVFYELIWTCNAYKFTEGIVGDSHFTPNHLSIAKTSFCFLSSCVSIKAIHKLIKLNNTKTQHIVKTSPLPQILSRISKKMELYCQINFQQLKHISRVPQCSTIRFRLSLQENMLAWFDMKLRISFKQFLVYPPQNTRGTIFHTAGIHWTLN